MAYTTGSAADMAAVKTALVNACTGDGWIEETDADGHTVLSKDGCFVQIRVIAISEGDCLAILGKTGLNEGAAPFPNHIGPVKYDDNTRAAISYPVAYHIFTFSSPAEAFLVIGYEDKFQWLSFGQSDQAGLLGTGNWVAGFMGGFGSHGSIRMSMNSSGSDGSTWAYMPGMFCRYGYRGYSIIANQMLHSGFTEAHPWSLSMDSMTTSRNIVGWGYVSGLLNTQPNNFNNESVLLPIRAYKERPEDKQSQVLEVRNARHVRVDHYADGEIIQLGDDKWMVFPYHRKNVSERNGGDRIEHTGTFGWAIRYEGP